MNEFVVLWRGVPKGICDPALEFAEGFNSQSYPGDGVYFASFLAIAQDFQRCYENGLQEIGLPSAEFKNS
jgi:hypothetical protein